MPTPPSPARAHSPYSLQGVQRDLTTTHTPLPSVRHMGTCVWPQTHRRTGKSSRRSVADANAQFSGLSAVLLGNEG